MVQFSHRLVEPFLALVMKLEVVVALVEVEKIVVVMQGVVAGYSS